jgi:hypothetical protein
MSKKFLRNAAIVLAIAVVAYVVMYGVKEGFQGVSLGTNEVIEYATVTSSNVSTLGINLPMTAYPSGISKLTGMKFYAWGPALMPAKPAGWVQITKPTTQASSTWQILSIGDKTNPKCNEQMRDETKGHVDASALSQCKQNFTSKPTIFALDDIAKSIYIKFAPKMTQWGASYPKTDTGIDTKKRGASANLAVVYKFA